MRSARTLLSDAHQHVKASTRTNVLARWIISVRAQ